ncbi:acyl-CoA dehydratase activase [Fibrobacterota bacterium]
MNTVLGIDIGSVAVSTVMVDEIGKIVTSDYRFHQGRIRSALLESLGCHDLSPLCGLAVTSSSPKEFVEAGSYDTQVSIIHGVKKIHPDAGSILIIGGENFGLIKFNEKGAYESLRTNTSCAAGTGSFLDQQARRLNLEGSHSLSESAQTNEIVTPKIATRCAVFAKTDLIHAQQEGFSLPQISDGLCEGLAKNVIDTLIPDIAEIRTPLVFAGGVSMNKAIIKHLTALLDIVPVVGEYSRHYGAYGAALLFLEEKKLITLNARSAEDIVQNPKPEKPFGYPPLKLVLSEYPDFSSLHKYLYQPQSGFTGVEADLYREMKQDQDIYIGIDVGSTSTKAALIDKDQQVIAGLYTRTSGQPLKAVQAVFEALEDMFRRHDVSPDIRGVGTTGSGRKYIGKIIKADLVIDEITAHALAAYRLNDKVDTIIEIGGQDAKFTTMKFGMVTFSVMNNVCAAGTGSFIEEQAIKLNCPLEDFARRALGASAPLSSDRCTVFMERDINHFLTKGYSVNEVLASVLHSVRENYLMRVAVEGNIGDYICFQGATAKNKALITAFEQKLKKPIYVSPYCHLTGALGSAMILSESGVEKSTFRGTGIHREQIPVESEACTLCQNNCKIRKVTIQGETVAFGFLCGRDYDTLKYTRKKKGGFNLLQERAELFRPTADTCDSAITIGIPSALFLSEEKFIWQSFFRTLGIKTITSETVKDPVKMGKKISGAEFCAPMQAFFGHVRYLSTLCDLMFLPVYLNSKDGEKEQERQYCYYSQYASSLAASVKSLNLDNRSLMPVVSPGTVRTIMELNRVLKDKIKVSYWEIYFAYSKAVDLFRENKQKLINIYKRESVLDQNLQVVFLGRPYIVLEPNMNKKIPDFFREQNIKCYFQDMIPYTKADIAGIQELSSSMGWTYVSKMMEVAYVAARTKGLYPVYVTSFKCSPDSFGVEYFKRIMNEVSKPYLILELDEHGYSGGYETRIEAAIRSFNNDFHSIRKKPVIRKSPAVVPKLAPGFQGKTLLLPMWDPINSKLLEAALIHAGIDARLVPLEGKAVQRGPRTNTGMCIPVNIIIQSIIDFVEENRMDPEEAVVWIFKANISCNIRMYAPYMKSLFEAHGKGMEKIAVYLGEFSFFDISIQLTIEVYFAYLFGGMLRKLGCRFRPYEVEKGATDRVLQQALLLFYNTFISGRDKDDDLIRVIAMFRKIKIERTERPQVALFGDFYVRDNDVMNQNIIHAVEDYGGEAVLMPLSEAAMISTYPHIKRAILNLELMDAFKEKAVVSLVKALGKNYYRRFNEILEEPMPDMNFDYQSVLKECNLSVEQSGESADNLLNLFFLKKQYPKISLFVQMNPAFCCAGLVTEAMSSRIEQITGVPVVSLTYDGTNKNQNEKLAPYIKYPIVRI